ncbi:MAG: peroxidase family protein, partial [Planctomycetia bacterium]
MRLKDAFFDPRPVSQLGIEPVLKYLASDRAQEIDTKAVDDVRNFLFGQPGQGGFDLAALNIQRGRDHGLADYNSVRVAYGLPRVTSFAEITPDPEMQASLRQAYGSVDRIDLWVGGLAEKHLPGSSLGPTFTRILVDQFSRLRDGDRYWYQAALPPESLRMVRATTLSDVIRRNSGLKNLQPDVFFFRTAIGGTVFADGNRDGQRQPQESGVPAATVTLVTAAGDTVAVTRTDPRGEYRFGGVDLGRFRVVVSLPTGSAGGGGQSREVRITRGMEVRDVHVALPPRAAAPTPTPPRPAASPSVLEAAFVGLAAAQSQGSPPKPRR